MCVCVIALEGTTMIKTSKTKKLSKTNTDYFILKTKFVKAVGKIK